MTKGKRRFNSSAIVISGIVVFLIFALIWSWWATLDQISRAPGQIIPSGRIQVLQSTDGGQITRINVQEGDQVRKGDVLVELDSARAQAAVNESTGSVASLLSAMARIEAELFGRPLHFPADVQTYPDFIANQTGLYHKRRQALNDQLGALNKSLDLARQESAMYKPLLDKGDISRADMLRLDRQVLDLRSEIVNVRNRYLEDLQAEYTRTEELLASAREQLAQRRDILKNTQITAPADGLVKDVNLSTPGGVLRPGEEVMSIVPTGGELVLEARMSPRDIATVKMGQQVTLRFDAYDSAIYGTALGKVIYISPDTIRERGSDGSENTYYRIHINVDTRPMKPRHAGEKIGIQPGMTAIAEIHTGSSTVWQYLTKPINRGLNQAMTER